MILSQSRICRYLLRFLFRSYDGPNHGRLSACTDDEATMKTRILAEAMIHVQVLPILILRGNIPRCEPNSPADLGLCLHSRRDRDVDFGCWKVYSSSTTSRSTPIVPLNVLLVRSPECV